MFDSNIKLNEGVAIWNVDNNIFTNSKPSGKPEFACPRHHAQLCHTFELSACSLYCNAAPVHQRQRQNHQ